MGTSRLWPLVLALAAAGAFSHEAATPSQCQAAAAQPPIAPALARVARNPDDARAQAALADAWSDAGCFNDAVSVLQSAASAHPDIAELQTRLRVARSLVGEEHFFEDLDRADAQAKLKRDLFRCENLSDLDACNEAARLKPDDAAVLVSAGDALLRAKRPAEALQRYRAAETSGGAASPPGLSDKIRLAEAALPPPAPASAAGRSAPPRVARAEPKAAPRRYSNVSPDAQSH
jgi:tetratricopeptide (TPR) repeat protein